MLLSSLSMTLWTCFQGQNFPEGSAHTTRLSFQYIDLKINGSSWLLCTFENQALIAVPPGGASHATPLHYRNGHAQTTLASQAVWQKQIFASFDFAVYMGTDFLYT